MDEGARDGAWTAPDGPELQGVPQQPGPQQPGQQQPAPVGAPQPYGQQPYGQQPSGPWPEQPWGPAPAPAAWGPPAPPPHHQPPYGQAPYPPPPYGQAPYPPPPYGQAPSSPPPFSPAGGWPAWQGAPPLPPRRSRRAMAVLAGAVAVALVAVGAVVVSERDDRVSTARVQAQVDARLPGLQAFVERERGLAFLRPVEVEVLADDAFLDALFSGGEDEQEPAGDAGATLHGLGLLEQDEDLDEAADDALSEGVAGFYDPETARLVVRGAEITPFVEMVLVHELTHALQDQHFDLSRPELDRGEDERGLAFTALVEGDATWVEDAWYEDQPAAVQTRVDDEEARLYGGGSDGPEVVDALLSFPYYAGPEYVGDLLDDGGQAALDAAFRTPPTTSEQVLHAGAEGPRPVPAPAGAPSGEQVDQGVLGESGLALLLGDRSDVEDEDAPPAGWGGDAYVTTTGDRGTCTTADVVMDDVQARDDLLDALQQWAGDQDDAEVTAQGVDGLRLVACTE